MSTLLQGKVIALTGGASGIGLATSKMLASRGAIVAMADVQEGPLSAAVKEIEAAGGKVTSTVVNVRDRKAVEAWIESVASKYGRLDGGVNLAGVVGKQLGVANIEYIDDDEWDFILGVNLYGVLNCLRAEIKAMTKFGKGGSIVNAASIAGIMGMPKNGAYIASKHAVVGLTRASAKECGNRNIRVNAIAPGPIETPMIHTSEDNKASDLVVNVPLSRVGKASEVAELICWLLCDGSSYMSGTIQSIDGGWAC